MTLTWSGTPATQTINAENSISQHFEPEARTPMTDEQRTMLAMWYGMSEAKVTAEFLANNLIRKFKINKNPAWILAVRYINEKRG